LCVQTKPAQITLSSIICPFIGESTNIGMPVIRYASMGLTSENFKLFLVFFPLLNMALVRLPSHFQFSSNLTYKKKKNNEIILNKN